MAEYKFPSPPLTDEEIETCKELAVLLRMFVDETANIHYRIPGKLPYHIGHGRYSKKGVRREHNILIRFQIQFKIDQGIPYIMKIQRQRRKQYREFSSMENLKRGVQYLLRVADEKRNK